MSTLTSPTAPDTATRATGLPSPRPTRQHTDPAHGLIGAGALLARHRSAATAPDGTTGLVTIPLPARFDVHRIDEVVATVEEAQRCGNDVLLDGQLVEMIDLAALRVLDDLVAGTGRRLVRASVALAMTIRYAAPASRLDAARNVTIPAIPTLANVA